jgi:DNA-binding transcriptional LysR family regulator
MTLKQLETFYWVCRLGGFAAAAKHLHSTQSAVSMRIQDLESSLGVPLFDRNQRSARLTAKGQDLIQYAERLMTAASEIRHRIGDPKYRRKNEFTFSTMRERVCSSTWAEPCAGVASARPSARRIF